MTRLPDLSTADSVFLASLGDRARLLLPEVRRYALGPGKAGGAFEGVFDLAGSRFRWLLGLLRPFVGPGLMMTGYQHGVPFRVRSRVRSGPAGVQELWTERTFAFRGGEQRFVDVLRFDGEHGWLHNVLGEAGRVELLLRCEAAENGHLRLRSEATWVRVGPLRFRLPHVLSVQAQVEDGFDPATGRQTIEARVRNPVLGTLLEYRGTFRYDPDATRKDRVTTAAES